MPNILYGENGSQDLVKDLTDINYNYDYPEDLDLRPGSTLHIFLKNEILKRARASRSVVEKRFNSWNEIDRVLTTYIPTTQAEKDIKTADSRKPVSIIFPYSYAVLDTLMTYMTMAFFQDPIFRYEGVSPEDTIGAILLEKAIELQCYKMKVPLSLHTMFRDSFAYGIGVTSPGWEVLRGFKNRPKSRIPIIGSILDGIVDRTPQKETLFEGSTLSNVDPYLYLPSPNVAAQDVQKGEYVGWVGKENYLSLLEDEGYDNYSFNAKYTKHVLNKKSIYGDSQSKRTEKFGESKNDFSDDVTTPIDVIWMYIKLVPKEWKIGTSEEPEKWLFGLAADSVIVKAKPLGLNHDMFPIAVAAPEFDGYTTTPISRIETLFGLQGVVDFMFNSHIANVRKAINDMFVVDPYLINTNDLKDPKPGKLIRMRRPAWGRGVEKAIQQLEVNDITRSNIADTSFIIQWMQKIGATDDPMMGSLRQGGPERLTKGEFQGTHTGAVSRLEKLARVISIQAMQDIAYMFASHTQQLMSKDVFVKASGRWQEDLIAEYGGAKKIQVDPYKINIEYDVVHRDGSVPGGNFAAMGVQLFNIMAQHPELNQKIDIYRFFEHVIRDAGCKNASDFKRVETKVMPDEEVANEVDKGNLTEMGM